MFESFTQRARKSLNLARKEAIRLNHEYVDTEHILLGLVGDGEGIAAVTLQNLGIDMESVRIETEALVGFGGGQLISISDRPFTQSAKKTIELAAFEARALGHNYIGTEHLLLGLIRENEGVASRVLKNLGVSYDKAEREILNLLGIPASGDVDKKTKGKSSILEDFGRDLTRLAKEDKIDPVIGRDKEIERIIQILSRRTKNNPILIGEPGVGKTAIAEGLAERIIKGNVSEILQDKRVIALDLPSVIAGTKYRGQFEERFKSIMKEVTESQNKIILFIDEIHTLIGAGAAEGAVDASNMLKPALARGELQCIGATTLDEYRKYIEKDGALERRFQPITVMPTTTDETIQIIKGLRQRYEKHHQVKISDDAITAAVIFADRYVADRFLPDKAIDLIDEACSKSRLHAPKHPNELNDLEKQFEDIKVKKEEAVKAQEFEKASDLRDKERELKFRIAVLKEKLDRSITIPIISAEDVSYVVSRWTGIQVTRLEEKETSRLLRMEAEIHNKFIGQEEAVKIISQAIRRSKAKLKDPKRPIGSFVFLGPTGVGKTQLARTLAEFLFGNEDALITFDMSEYQEKYSVSRLIGSPPGYVGYEEGGLLTEKIRRRPYSVILLDEIEKAHPDIFSIFLQIMEDGHITDSLGHVVDFRNTVLIMTSNIGARQIEKNTTVGFKNYGQEENYFKMKEKVMDELKNTFRPEFLNRMDEIVVFHPLNSEELKKIIDLFIGDIENRIEFKKIKINVSEKVKDFLILHRDNPSYGARSLKRTIQKYIEDPMTDTILMGKIHDGSCINVEVNGEKLTFSTEEITPEFAIAGTDGKYND